jgi:hypothetical protein
MQNRQHNNAALLGNGKIDNAVRESPDQCTAGVSIALGIGLWVGLLRMRWKA